MPRGTCASPKGWLLREDARGAGHVPTLPLLCSPCRADPICSQVLPRKAFGSMRGGAHPEQITCTRAINLFAGGTLEKLRKVSA